MRAFNLDLTYHYVDPNTNWIDDPNNTYGLYWSPKTKTTIVLANTIGEAFTKVLSDIQTSELKLHIKTCEKAKAEDKFPPEQREVNITRLNLEEVHGHVIL